MEALLNHPLFSNPGEFIYNFQWVQGTTAFTSLLAPTIASLVYITGLVAIPRFMQKRDPYKLKGFAAAHNLILSAWSLLMFGFTSYYIASVIIKDSLYGAVCDPTNQLSKGPQMFWYYIFYLSKYYEFLDTLIQLLRKKQPIFLHTYHHVITLWLVWVTISMDFAIQWADITANAFVHIVMYYYYFLSEVGIQVGWKRYITKIQIVQFVWDISTHFVWLYYKQTTGCSGSMFVFYFGNFVIGSFLLLFIKFYFDAYKNRGAQKKQA